MNLNSLLITPCFNKHSCNRLFVDILVKLAALLLLCFVFFFGYTDYSIKYIILLAMIYIMLILYISQVNEPVNLTYYDVFFMLFIVFGFISLITGKMVLQGFVYLAIWIIGLIIKTILSHFIKISNFIVNMFFFAAGIHVLAILLQVLHPQLIMSVNEKILDSNTLSMCKMFLSISAYTGITNQTGTASFFTTIFIGTCIAYLITGSSKNYLKKVMLICCIFVSFIAMLATQRRGPLLFSIMSIAFVLFIWYARIRKKTSHFVTLLVLFGLTLALMLNFTEFGHVVLYRFQYGSYGDVYSNRSNLFELFWSGFFQMPVMGYGLGSTIELVSVVNETQGHNIYLQTLYEMGIPGILCLLLYMSCSFVYTIKQIRLCYHTYSNISWLISLLISLYIQIYVILYGITENPIYDHYQFLIYMVYCTFPMMKNMKTQKVERLEVNKSPLIIL